MFRIMWRALDASSGKKQDRAAAPVAEPVEASEQGSAETDSAP